MCRFDSYSQSPESLVEDFKVFGFCYYRSMKRIYVTTLLFPVVCFCLRAFVLFLEHSSLHYLLGSLGHLLQVFVQVSSQ